MLFFKITTSNKEIRNYIFNYVSYSKRKYINKYCYNKYLDSYFPEKYQDWECITNIFKNNQEKIAILNLFFDISDYKKIIHNIYKDIKKEKLESFFIDNFHTANDLLKIYEIIKKNVNNVELDSFSQEYSLLPHEFFFIELLSNIFKKKKLDKYLIKPEKRIKIKKNKTYSKQWYDILYYGIYHYNNINNITINQFNIIILKTKIIHYTYNTIIFLFPENYHLIIQNFLMEQICLTEYLYRNKISQIMKQFLFYILLISYISFIYIFHIFCISILP